MSSTGADGFSEARLDEIEAVAAVLRDSPVLTEIEVRQGDVLLRVRRSPAARVSSALTLPAVRKNGAEPASPSMETIPANGDAAAALPSLSAEDAAEAATPVTASLVGVFHALRAGPLAPGDRVILGQAVGQIEAMRLMNDVNAPASGIVAVVHVEEGQPVEYGQALFEIAPAAGVPQEETS